MPVPPTGNPSGREYDPGGTGRKRKGRNRAIPPVFIDGELAAFLQYGDLPPTFEPTVVQRTGDDYNLCYMVPYLEALGVDVAKLRSLHLVGSSRTSAISGEEVRDKKDKLRFTFSRRRGTFGRPMVEWPLGGIETNTRIDRISAVFIFQEKDGPVWNKDKKMFVWEDGRAAEEVPYNEDFEDIRHPRIYLDGKLVTVIRENELPKELFTVGTSKGTGKSTKIAEDPDLPGGDGSGKGKKGGGKGKGRKGDGSGKGGVGGGKKFDLAKVLKHFKIDPDAIQALELIGEDRVLARFDQKAWRGDGEKLTFGIPKRSTKNLRMEAPEAATPYPGPIAVQAIAVYSKVKPREREVSKPKRRPRKRK